MPALWKHLRPTMTGPLPAAVVRPGQPAAILIGVASRRSGYRRIRAFTVRYHVGRAQPAGRPPAL